LPDDDRVVGVAKLAETDEGDLPEPDDLNGEMPDEPAAPTE